MPCRGEKSVATAGQQGKQTKPLATSAKNNDSENNENVESNDETNNASKPGGKSAVPDKSKQKQSKTGNSTEAENKENDANAGMKDDGKVLAKTPAKTPGLCRGSKSVEVAEQNSPDVQTKESLPEGKESPEKTVAVEKDNGNIENGHKQTQAPKRSGFCRSNKDVQVIDTSAQQRQQEQPGVQMAGKPSSPTTDIAATNSEKEGIDGKPATIKDAKSGGFCRNKSDVAVNESATKTSAQADDKKADLEQQKDERSKTSAQKVNSTNEAAPDKKTTEKSSSCCGGRSVQVEESLRPLDKPGEKAEPPPIKVEDDSFGEPVYAGLPDLSREERSDKTNEEESFEQIEDEDEDEEDDNISEAEDKVIVYPDPPPPRLKKKKKGNKKKQGSSDYVEDEPTKGGGALTISSRKGKYSVTSPQQQLQEEEPLYAQVEKSPVKKKQTLAKQAAAAASAMPKDSPSRKKKKRMDTETNDDIRSAYENQIASLAATSGSEGGFTINDHPTVEEESELLENAEAERKKNKQRLREKKLRESSQESPVKKGDATNLAYENAQREIDKVLAPKIIAEDNGEEDDDDESNKKKKKKHKDKSKKKKKEKDKDGEDNEAYSSEGEKVEESLEEAKAKMHQLLDDAFSLFSHSRSSIGNKVAPSKQSSEEKSSPKARKKEKESPRSQEGSEKSTPRQEEKKHTPMHIIRSHELYDRSGLVTWDPYKASDESAVISLPSTQTNLSTQPPQQEKLTTSTFTESLPGSLRPNYYATQPAEPIVIKSRELEGSNQDGRGHYVPPRSSDQPSTGPLTNGHNGAPYHHGTFQNPLYDSSSAHGHRAPPPSSSLRNGSRHAPPYHQQPVRLSNQHYEPYYGLSSFQEIPQSSTIPGQVMSAADNPDDAHSSLRHREASALNGMDTLNYSNPTLKSNNLGRNIIGSRDYHPNNNYYHHEMLARPGPEDSSRVQNGRGSGDAEALRSHTAPQRGENPNIDVVDAITGSLRPGASPQPLINSLREEVQLLASRRGLKEGNATTPAGGTHGDSTLASKASRDKNFSQTLR